MLLLNNRNSAMCVALFSLYGLCNPMTYCLVEVSFCLNIANDPSFYSIMRKACTLNLKKISYKYSQ